MFALLKNRDKCHKKTAVPTATSEVATPSIESVLPGADAPGNRPQSPTGDHIDEPNPPRTDHGDLSFHTFKGRYNGRQLAVF